jgi:imidazoleglycerol-phosphate dehydratase
MSGKKTAGGPVGRRAEIRRETKETRIEVVLNLDGSGNTSVSSGIGFLDHMLATLGRHAAWDLSVNCQGDNQVDDHHSVEDIGIVLGGAFAQALGDKKGIVRFGFASVPLDEALAQVTVDLSGRAHFSFSGRTRLGRGKVGGFDIELVEDFLMAFVQNAALTLHLELRSGRNAHHKIEAVFKALARALRQASGPDGRLLDIPSTKGKL